MTVAKALDLITSNGVKYTKNNFQSVTSWHFDYQGEAYRLCEWEGIGVYVETLSLPRKRLDHILLNEGHPHAPTFLRGT